MQGESTRRLITSELTARHSTLFTLRSGQSDLWTYTMQMDAALGQQCRAGAPPHLPIQNLLKRSNINQPGHFNEENNHRIGITGILTNDIGAT